MTTPRANQQPTAPLPKPPKPAKPAAPPEPKGGAGPVAAASAAAPAAGVIPPLPDSAQELSKKLGVPEANIQKYGPGLADAMKSAGITDRNTAIGILATIKAETGSFEPIPESGGGSQYEGRADLGNTQPGDGNRFMGRGFVQLTGRANYQSYGQKLGVDLVGNPDLALDPKVSAQILVQYFKDHNIPQLAQAGDWQGVRKAVNGGLNGWDTFSQAVQALNGGGALPMTTSAPGGASGGSSSSDSNAVGGGGSPSGMSLGGSGGSGPPGGSGPAASAGSPASAGTPVASSGAPVPSGDFNALLAKLQAMGIDRAYLEELAKRYGVPLDMILAIIMQESGGDPNAKSGAGAQGLMQLMPGTAAGLGVTNPLDPRQNVEAGVKYLSQLHGMARAGGDWTNVAGMYNAGPAGNFGNPETANYMRSVPLLRAKAASALGAAPLA